VIEDNSRLIRDDPGVALSILGSASTLRLEGEPVALPQARLEGGDAVFNHGVIEGNGQIFVDVLSEGTIRPGLSVGTIVLNGTDLSLKPPAVLEFELRGDDLTAGAGVNDVIYGVVDLVLDGTLHVTELTSFAANAVAGDAWTLISYTGSLTYNGLELGTVPSFPDSRGFAIQDTGSEIQLVVISDYASYMAAYGLSGGDAHPDVDFDHDDIENGIEYVIGADPTCFTPRSFLPTLTRVPGGSEFVFRRTDASAADDPRVEYDTDLQDPRTPEVHGVADVTITGDDDFFGANIDRVTVFLPDTLAVDGKLFARLAIEPAL
jgi:hypothetical protein